MELTNTNTVESTVEITGQVSNTNTTDTTNTTTTQPTTITTSTTNTNSTVTTSQGDGTTITGTTTYSLDDVAKQLNVQQPSWDAFLIGFFIVGALLYGMSLGKDRIIAIMVSIYMALAVVAALPQFALNVKLNDSYTLQITAFFTVFVILFFLLSRQAVLNALAPNNHGKWWQVLLFSFLHVGLLVSVVMSFLPPMVLTKFSPLAQLIFTGEWPQFGWIIAPIVAMIVVGRNKE